MENVCVVYGVLTAARQEAGRLPGRELRCNVLASPTEIYGLDVTAFAARRLDVSHRWGVRMKFQRTRVRFPNRNAIPRIETILRIVLKSIALVLWIMGRIAGIHFRRKAEQIKEKK